jgi:hypothetical protein
MFLASLKMAVGDSNAKRKHRASHIEWGRLCRSFELQDLSILLKDVLQGEMDYDKFKRETHPCNISGI